MSRQPAAGEGGSRLFYAIIHFHPVRRGGDLATKVVHVVDRDIAEVKDSGGFVVLPRFRILDQVHVQCDQREEEVAGDEFGDLFEESHG